jgi:hypothetical protein
MNNIRDSNNPITNKNQIGGAQSFDPIKSMVAGYSNNKSMYDNTNKYFDSKLFNNKFDNYIKNEDKERLLKEKMKLYDLNHIANIPVYPYQLPFNKILININQTWFGIYDDITHNINPINTITNNKIFYIGVTFIAISLLYIILTYIFELV